MMRSPIFPIVPIGYFVEKSEEFLFLSSSPVWKMKAEIKKEFFLSHKVCITT